MFSILILSIFHMISILHFQVWYLDSNFKFRTSPNFSLMNSDTPTTTTQCVFEFTGYDIIYCLSVADMLLALGQLGVTCTKDTSKTKLTSALLQALFGDFTPASAKRQESQ
jgi:hypothetical protein